MKHTILHTVSALGVAIAITAMVGCGSQPDKTAPLTGGGNKATARKTLDLSNLAAPNPIIGRALAGDLIPIATPGISKENRGAIKIFDSARGTLTATAPLSLDGWLGDTDVVAINGRVVALAQVCSSPVIEGDAGYECVNEGSITRRVLVLDAGDSKWKGIAAPPETDGLALTSFTPDGVVLGSSSLSASNDSTAEIFFVPIINIKSTTSAPATSQCAMAQYPPIMFDRAEAPSTATLIDDAGKRSSVQLDDEIASSLNRISGTAIACQSARGYLAIPGTLRPRRKSEGHGPAEPANVTTSSDPTEAGSNVAAQRPGDKRVSIYDVRAEKLLTRLGDTESTQVFLAGENYFVLQDGSGIHMRSIVNPGKAMLIPAGPSATLRATRSSLVVFTQEAGGALKTASTYEPAP